ncbi:MAG: hypothetical protein QME61_00395 [Patescibacteria group bacterium]|nr:hypothetical protein [Patescibacteria group bacterium]
MKKTGYSLAIRAIPKEMFFSIPFRKYKLPSGKEALIVSVAEHVRLYAQQIKRRLFEKGEEGWIRRFFNRLVEIEKIAYEKHDLEVIQACRVIDELEPDVVRLFLKPLPEE